MNYKWSHKKIFQILLLSFAISLPGLYSQTKTIAIRGGRLMTMTHGIIEDGILLMRGGKIEEIGKDIPIPEGATVIDIPGKTVLPGLIDGFTNLGMADIKSYGKDDDEATDPLTPQLRIIDALNPDNRFIPLARNSGVTSVLCAPAEGNLLSGQSGFIQLAEGVIEDMILQFPVGIHGCLGEAPKLRYGKKNQAPMTRMGAAALLRQTFIDALDYADKIERYQEKLEKYEKEKKKDDKKPEPPKKDFKLQSLIPIVRGEKPLIIGANRFDDILTALRIAEEFDLKIILNHGTEAYRVAEKIASGNIPVILGPSTSFQQKQETEWAVPENAALLNKAGVKIAFQTGSIQNVSGLLNEARLAVANGLPYNVALKALTLYPAQIFGVDDEVGSLEKGKSGDIVIFDGDPLKELSRVVLVFIGGEKYEGNDVHYNMIEEMK